MAPFTVSPTGLGLHKSEIHQPPPLRIVKRSKTISGSSTSGESLDGGRGYSGSPLHGRGSPPFATDRPLTVHKLRKSRASVLSSSTESSGGLGCESSIFELAESSSGLSHDMDLTPKGKPASRVTSAGAFLKAEYHGGKDHSDVGYFSLRANRYAACRPARGFPDQPIHAPSPVNTSPEIPQRRLSKSKNFLIRAMGGRVGATPQPISRSNSTASRTTLIRRISRRRDSSIESRRSSSDDDTLSSVATCTYAPAGLRIYDAELQSTLQSHLPPCPSDSMHDSSQHAFVLYPHIIVTPEVSSLDTGLSIIWIAIQVNGVLRSAEGSANQSPEVQQFPASSANPQLADLECYGKLHSMRIDLHPGRGCTVLEIIGNLHESKTVRAGETQLVLAKIRLGEIKPQPEGSEDSTEGMIEDLQNQLGDAISSYLTVRLTYKHSAFPNHKPLEPLDGMKLRMSRIETEATATIKRRNLESAWSPRASRIVSNSLESSPVITLVNTHFPPEKAAEVRRRLLHNRSPISIARKFGYWSDESGDNTTEPPQNDGMGVAIDTVVNASFEISSSRSLFRKSKIPRAPAIPFSQSLNDEDARIRLETMDPARKIWSEMRLTSRGDRKQHSRTSISANHYISTEEERRLAQRNSEERVFSRISAVSDTTCSVPVARLRNDRESILEAALRNKRSVGAETLRSIAPSVASVRGDGKSKYGSATGPGLGVGRGWGWAMPWW